MKRVLVDINVVLDVLLDREPHVTASAAVWAAIESGAVQGMLAAHTVTTIHHLVAKELGPREAKRTVGALLRVFDVAAVDRATMREALDLSMGDFEDAVIAAAAQSAGCDAVITRDLKGFRSSPVRVFTPEAAAPILGGSERRKG